MIDWGDILTGFIRDWLPTLILAVAAWLFRTLLPTLRAKYEASLTLEQRRNIEAIVRTGVTMAEQVWQREDVQRAFNSKKQLAYTYVDGQLQKLGIRMTLDEVESLIEAAVWQEINREPKVETIVNNAELVATGSPAVEVAPHVLNAGAIGTGIEKGTEGGLAGQGGVRKARSPKG
jgi:hypothetical protein